MWLSYGTINLKRSNSPETANQTSSFCSKIETENENNTKQALDLQGLYQMLQFGHKPWRLWSWLVLPLVSYMNLHQWSYSLNFLHYFPGCSCYQYCWWWWRQRRCSPPSSSLPRPVAPPPPPLEDICSCNLIWFSKQCSSHTKQSACLSASYFLFSLCSIPLQEHY